MVLGSCFPCLKKKNRVVPSAAKGSKAHQLSKASFSLEKSDERGFLSGENEEDARELVGKLLPFIPRRVAASFASGFYEEPVQSLRAWTPPMPLQLHAAVLLVDVSGFTRLSEAFAQLGTEGCEEFSLIMSNFFARMCATIEAHGGDVDCFAGDALLIIFPVSSSSENDDIAIADDGSAAPTLGAAVGSAVKCAIAICQALNGYSPSESHPSLGIHCALSAGTVFAVECGGSTTPRCEAFIAGQPLQELGEAMPLAENSELVAAGSAVAALPSAWESAESRGGNCMCIRLPKAPKGHALQHAGTFRSHSFKHAATGDRHDAYLHPDTAAVLEYAAKMYRMRDNPQQSSVISISAASVTHNSLPLRHHRNSTTASFSSHSSRLSSSRLSSASLLEDQLSQLTDSETYGLEALMMFLPSIVRQRCVEKMSLDMLAENRTVSIMFMIADFQGVTLDRKYLRLIQTLIAKVIDIAEGEYGGATRQITVDEKGLAAIFVFGLPGFSHSSHTLPCVNAAAQATDIMREGGVSCSAGLATGSCFCGLLGDPSKRCEYAVIGDTVNTGARVAWAARKKDLPILCTEEFKSYLSTSHGSSSVKMTPAVRKMLKGKKDEATLYAPELLGQSLETATLPDLVDRETHVSSIVNFISGICCSERGQQQAYTPGSRLMVAEGPVGIGKSILLSVLHHRVIPSMHNGVQNLLVRAHRKGTPFSLCQQILQKLMELDGEADPSRFSRLEGDHMADIEPHELPQLLAPVARHLAELHNTSDAFKKAEGFQKLYLNVLQAGLQSRPTVLLVDDVVLADAVSVSILVALGQDEFLTNTGLFNMGRSSRPIVQQQDNRRRFAIIMTTGAKQLHYCPINISQSTECNMLDLMEDPDVSILELLPLKGDGIEALALQVLCGGSPSELRLDPTMLEILVDKSEGVPLHVLELIWWLDDHSMLDKDGTEFICLRKKAESAALTPPSLETIVRSQIDQLAPKIGEVLKCASIQGHTFDVELLQMTVGAELGLDKVSLEMMISNLANRQIIQGTGNANTWQFCQISYREVLYRNILHKHKRNLHRLVAKILQKQKEDIAYQFDTSYNKQWDMQERLCHHLKALMSSNKSQKGSFANDLRMYTDAVRWLAKGHLKSGQVKEALNRQTQLQEWLSQPSQLSNASEEYIHAQREIATYCMELLFQIQLTDPDRRVITASEASNRSFEINKALECLSKVPEETEETFSPMASYQQPAAGAVAVIKVNAKIGKVMAKFVSNKKRISKADSEKLLSWYAEEKHAELKIMYGMFAIITSWVGTRFLSVATVAREIFDLWEQAGCPSVPSMYPMKPATAMMVGLSFGPLMCGSIDHPGDKWRILKRVEMAEYGQRHLVYGKSIAFEGVWEPQSSPRVKFWKQEAEKAIAAANGATCWWFTMTGSVREPLEASLEQDRLTWPALHVASSSHDDPVDEKAALAQEQWADLTRQATDAMETSRYFVYPLILARNLIEEGCRVLFPAPRKKDGSLPSMLALTSLGLEHLAVVAETLSKCLKRWEVDRVNDSIGCSLLPASLIWSKSMLFWFQWQLVRAGLLSEEDIEDPRLLHGLAGWPRGPDLMSTRHHGPIKAIASRLLLAQAMSMSDSNRTEPLTACLTSTIALARLLAGQGDICVPAGDIDSASDLRSLPEKLVVPSDPMLGDESATEAGPSASIRVVCVKQGSAPALETACNHIRGVIMSRGITVNGRTLGNPGNIKRMREVGDSETLWTAVLLYKALRQRLAGMAMEPERDLKAAWQPAAAGIPGTRRPGGARTGMMWDSMCSLEDIAPVR